LGHPCKFQRDSRLGSVTARHSSSGRQPNLAASKRGRHLYSAGRPSRWASAHILVYIFSACMCQHRCNYRLCALTAPNAVSAETLSKFHNGSYYINWMGKKQPPLMMLPASIRFCAVDYSLFIIIIIEEFIVRLLHAEHRCITRVINSSQQ